MSIHIDVSDVQFSAGRFLMEAIVIPSILPLILVLYRRGKRNLIESLKMEINTVIDQRFNEFRKEFKAS